MSDLYIVSRVFDDGRRVLTGHPWDKFRGRWEWTTYHCENDDFWLTAEQLEVLRADAWYGTHLDVRKVSDGPWHGYWHPEGPVYNLYTSRKTVEFTYREPPVGPYTLTVTSSEDSEDPEVFWVWQTPRDKVKPSLVFKSKIKLGVAGGDLSTLLHGQSTGRGRILPVRLTRSE